MNRLALLLIVLAILGAVYLFATRQYSAPAKDYESWSAFMRDVEAGKIRSLVVKGSVYSGEFRDGIVPSGPDDPPYMRFHFRGPDWKDIADEAKQAIATNILSVQTEP